VKTKFRIYNPAQREKFAEIEGIVDTGTIYTIINRNILESIGLKPV